MVTTACAKPISFLVKDKANNYYRYSYDELMEDAINNAIGSTSLLFDDYSKYDIIAYEDDVNSYIDGNAVMEEALNCALNNKFFDLETYLSNDGKKHIINQPESIIRVMVDNGNIVKNSEENQFDVITIY